MLLLVQVAHRLALPMTLLLRLAPLPVDGDLLSERKAAALDAIQVAQAVQEVDPIIVLAVQTVRFYEGASARLHIVPTTKASSLRGGSV